MQVKNDKKNLEKMQQEYEELKLKEVCGNLISIVLPQMEQISMDMAEKYGRPVVQYITSRVKKPESIMNKLIRKRRKVTMEKAMETFNDLAGIRVVCSFQDDVYRVVKVIRKLPILNVVKVKDYIAHPKATGYRSIHIIVEVPSSGQTIRLEIQVCSAAMNYWAMLEHQLSYKNSKGDEKEIERIQKELKSYAVQIADIDKQFLRVRKKIEKL